MTAQTLGITHAGNQELCGNNSQNELLDLYRLLARKDLKIEELVNLLNEKDTEILNKEKEILELKEEIKKLKEQHNTNTPDQKSEFNREKIIACSVAKMLRSVLIFS